MIMKNKCFVQLETIGITCVSRSEARNVLTNLDKFKEIILDFDQVPTVGQAFADEIFRVFKSAHPDIKIETTNTNKAIEFMIGRVASAE